MDGFFLGAFLIFLAGILIDVSSGRPARAGSAIVILLIVIGIIVHSITKEKNDKRERIEKLKEYFPGKPEYYYRQRVELDLDGSDILGAVERQKIAELKKEVPGKTDWWYKTEVRSRAGTWHQDTNGQ